MSSPHQHASCYLTQQRTALATAIVEAQYRQQPDVWARFGSEGYAKSVRDGEYHLAYLAEALATADAPARRFPSGRSGCPAHLPPAPRPSPTPRSWR